MFRTSLPNGIIKKLFAVPPPNPMNGSDFWLWPNNRLVSEPYVLRESSNTRWSLIWKLHVPERINTFAWLISVPWKISHKRVLLQVQF